MRIVLLAELVPCLAVNLTELNGQLAAAHILTLDLQAVNRIVDLAVDVFAVVDEIVFDRHLRAFHHRDLFVLYGNGQFLNAQLLVAQMLIKLRALAVAVGFEIVEGDLHMLTILVNGVNQTALRLALKGDGVAVFIGIKLELTAAEGNFFTLVLIA